MKKIMEKTKTAWDNENYSELLKSAIIKSNSVNRTGDKPMAALSDKFDTHLSYRLVHELDAASVIKRLAEGLNLNGELAYIGMMMHDVGHPFSAHDGEEIFTLIGKLYNCGYFHHNAKGVEVITAENILDTTLGMIKDIEYRPELRKQLEKDFNYFLDIVVSHDGEADPKDLTKRPKHYDTIEEAVEDKLRKSNTKNDYKFVSQTPEGMLAKYADVIAYLSSDVRDGFRLGILKTFNDKYLELFGRIVSTNKDIEDNENGRKVAIEIAKAKISEIQKKYLEEYAKDIQDAKNADILETTRNIINEINSKQINTYMLSKYYDRQEFDEETNKKIIEEEKNLTEEEKSLKFERENEEYETKKEEIEEQVNEILQKHLEKFIEDKGEISSEQYNNVKAEIMKITDYVNEMLYMNTKVVNEVTNIVQEYFVNDLIENTKDQIKDIKEQIENGIINEEEAICVPLLSDKAATLYTKAKNFGYTFYVPQTKTRYQKELLPRNAKKIIEYCANSIIKDGIIQRKLCDRTIKNQIPKEFIKYTDNIQQVEADEEIHDLKTIASAMTIKGRYTTQQKNKKAKFDIVSKLKRNITKQSSRFAKTYTYTCEAMEHQIRNKVERAISPNYKYDESRQDIIEIALEKDIQKIRENILSNYPNIAAHAINDEDKKQKEEQKEQIIQNLLNEERKKIVEKMAIQLSIDYVSGMTDEGIKDLAIDLGYMTQQEYEEAQNERGGEASENVKRLQQMTSDGR